MSRTVPPLPKNLLARIRRYKAPFQPGPYQEAWLETMEADLHNQCKSQLWEKDDDGEYAFCCLGLACEVLRENKLRGVEEDGGRSLPPRRDSERMGLIVDPEAGEVDINKKHRLFKALRDQLVCTAYLFNLNDLEEWTFPQIAWLVRQLPDLYFTGPK